MRDTFGWLLFRVIGNSLKFLITQKGTNVPMMRTRAKQKHVASDRARRENVPRHILFYGFCSHHLFIYGVQITGIPL